MSKRHKLSGAQGKKKRKEEEEKRSNDRDAMLRFLHPTLDNPPVASTSSTSSTSTSDAAASSSPATSTLATQPGDTAASSGPPATSTSATQPGDTAASSGPPATSTSATQPGDTAASSGPPATSTFATQPGDTAASSGPPATSTLATQPGDTAASSGPPDTSTFATQPGDTAASSGPPATSTLATQPGDTAASSGPPDTSTLATQPGDTAASSGPPDTSTSATQPGDTAASSGPPLTAKASETLLWPAALHSPNMPVCKLTQEKTTSITAAAAHMFPDGVVQQQQQQHQFQQHQHQHQQQHQHPHQQQGAGASHMFPGGVVVDPKQSPLAAAVAAWQQQQQQHQQQHHQHQLQLQQQQLRLRQQQQQQQQQQRQQHHHPQLLPRLQQQRHHHHQLQQHQHPHQQQGAGASHIQSLASRASKYDFCIQNGGFLHLLKPGEGNPDMGGAIRNIPKLIPLMSGVFSAAAQGSTNPGANPLVGPVAAATSAAVGGGGGGVGPGSLPGAADQTVAHLGFNTADYLKASFSKTDSIATGTMSSIKMGKYALPMSSTQMCDVSHLPGRESMGRIMHFKGEGSMGCVMHFKGEESLGRFIQFKGGDSSPQLLDSSTVASPHQVVHASSTGASPSPYDRPTNFCKSCEDVEDISDWILMEPAVSMATGVLLYSHSSDPGRFECTVSGLRWVCATQVTLQYHFNDSNIFREELAMLQYTPIGPLMSIEVISGKLLEAHLPHFACLDGSDAALKDAVRVLRAVDSGVHLVSCELTRFHAKVTNPSFSLTGVLMKLGVPMKTHLEVLIYRIKITPLVLLTYVVPRDDSMIQAVEKEIKKNKPNAMQIVKPRPHISMWFNTECSLKASTGDAKITPPALTLEYTSLPYFFEVAIKNVESSFDLELVSTDQSIWKATLDCEYDEIREAADSHRTQLAASGSSSDAAIGGEGQSTSWASGVTDQDGSMASTSSKGLV
ncbi:uncharacterized protein LOC134444801 [Engraulis encrasicolus]|uniref:uncharacterized protein LOC134444801 n=1 Tax=Engraulis encrasicolus TaxID=184585 RepID=UPI002FD798F6